MKKKIFISFLAYSTLLFCQAFKNPPESSSALSQAGAFVAQSNDASAINFNPAGLIQIEGGEFMFGFNFPYVKTDYIYSSGKEGKKFNFTALPYFYFLPDIKKENFKFGIGLNFPYGQSTEWSKDIVRYWQYEVPYYSGMQTGNLISAFSFKLSPEFSIGFGLNLYYSRLILKNLIFINPPGIETSGKMNLDGEGYGGSIGLLYKKNKFATGLTYKTKFKINYDGKSEIYGVGSNDAEMEINFPDILSFGIAFYPKENFKIEFDGEYYGFSSIDKIYINPGFSPPYEMEKNWKNVYNFYLGTEYRKNENLKLRGGIARLTSPIPEETWEPGLPDANTTIIALGTEIKTKIGKIDITLLNSFPEKIKKEGKYEGTYKSRGFFLAIGYKKEL